MCLYVCHVGPSCKGVCGRSNYVTIKNKLYFAYVLNCMVMDFRLQGNKMCCYGKHNNSYL